VSVARHGQYRPITKRANFARFSSTAQSLLGPRGPRRGPRPSLVRECQRSEW
jgi:hypothetical protein